MKRCIIVCLVCALLFLLCACATDSKVNAKGYIDGVNLLSSMRLCSNVQAQYIIKPALEIAHSADPLLQPGGRVWEQREVIWKAMNSIPGMSAVKPKAAFYIFPRIDAAKFSITNDEQFVLDLLRAKKILLVHGGGFHWEQPDHFRIVYLPDVSVLKEASYKMAEFLADYKQK